MPKRFKVPLEKLQQQNDYEVGPDLATYVDGTAGFWLPPSEGVLLNELNRHMYSDQWVIESCLVLGIPNLFDQGRAGGKPIEGVWLSLPRELEVELSANRYINFLDFARHLLGSGWNYMPSNSVNTKSLLRDFLRLAAVEPEEGGPAVKKFVQKWGPLWLCTTHAGCYWTPPNFSTLFPYFQQLQCTWFPNEPVVAYLAAAKQAAAAISIAGSLAARQPAQAEYWRALKGFRQSDVKHLTARDAHGGLSQDDTLQLQRYELLKEINRYLRLPNGPGFRLLWSDEQARPVMVHDSGLGFIKLVWLQMAQAITGNRGIYKCDGCSSFYVSARKPPEGRHHFCPSCAGNKRGSKRLWARRSRATDPGDSSQN